MFKPKTQKDNQQPFYMAWFSSQGENPKRGGGTAPHQSRKEKLQFKSPYQQPLTYLVNMAPNPYSKTLYERQNQPKTFQSNIQQISKIYASQGTKKRSMERRYDQEVQKSQRGSFNPTRTFTQQNQRPFRFSESQQGRPQTQQLSLEPKMQCEKLVVDPQIDNYDDQDCEIYEMDNNDDFSNQSNDADSDEHQNLQLPTQHQEEFEMQKNKSFVQKQKEEPIIYLRKATASMNRPQTSEGGKRRRFMNSLNQEEQNAEPQKIEDPILNWEPNIIQEDDTENLEIETNIQANFAVQQVDQPYSQRAQDLQSIRSGQRRKPTDQRNINDRPPSRHKTPPKATDLELPLQNGVSEVNRESIDIPIKNMYAQIEEHTKQPSQQMNDEFDEFDLGFFKNKVNFTKFQDGYQTDEGKNNNESKHPFSATSKQPEYQNISYSPMNSQNVANHEIVIKYNKSSALKKNQSNQPVKVPFQTSLGQDFLRLFANDCIE